MSKSAPKPDRGSPAARTDETMLVQETMRTLGLSDGKIDGLPGTRTMIAVRSFKKSSNMPVNNTLNADFIEYIRNHT